MISLHIETVMAAYLVMNLVCLVVLVILWDQNRRRYNGLDLWVGFIVMQAAGSILIGLRGIAPDWISIIVGNGLLAGGVVLLFYGLNRFFGKRINPGLNALIGVLLAVYVAVQIYFTLGQNNLQVRNYNTSVGLMLASILCLWLMLWGVKPMIRALTRGTAIAFGLVALISLLRTLGFVIFLQSNNDLLQSSLYNCLMILFLTSASVFLVFNIVLLVNRRLFKETKEMEEQILESQRELQAIFRTTSVGFAVLENRRFETVNEAACSMLGYNREELLGQKSRLIYPTDEDYHSIEKVFELAKYKGAGSVETRLRRKNGEIINVIMNIAVFEVKDSGLRVVVSLVNITTRKKLEEDLKEEIQVRTRFIDILAHELRSPLSPILSSNENLKDLLADSDNETLKRLSANAFAGALVLSERLEELLDVARYSRGAFILHYDMVDIASFIQEVAARYQPFLEKSQHRLELKLAADLPETAIDVSRIEQVIINLLSNAEKYSPKGTRIELEASTDRDQWIIEVKDEGQGISEIDQRNLFKPYQRLKQNQQGVTGLGLGLSITKQIVEAHGGKIQVSSQVGQGSTFRVIIPIKKLE